MRIARRYLVAGRVQGVGFRFFTRLSAERYKIDGWARNSPDGRVEIEAAGDSEAMMRFEQDIREGPPGADVADVEIAETPIAGINSGFRIR